MSSSTAPRTELLSKRGKKLLQRAFSGERLQNEFSLLCMDDDDDDDDYEDSSSMEEDLVNLPAEPINQARSPRFSPRMSPRLHGYLSSSPSPRWTKITPRKRMPKFSLNNTAVTPPSAAASTSFYEEDIGDLSNLAALTVDSKGRRSKHRKQHGNKPNQFKAREQRLYSQGRREEQRQASKAARASSQREHGSDDEELSYDSE